MVAAQRVFEGSLPLAKFTRLVGVLADSEGACRYRLAFGRTDTGNDVVDIELDTQLPLICQRSLERFLFPVTLRQRLGLIRSEAQESALPEGVEAVLVPEDGQMPPAELIEDELILAVPVVAIDPRSEPLESEPEAQPATVEEKPNPFAALAALKGRT